MTAEKCIPKEVPSEDRRAITTILKLINNLANLSEIELRINKIHPALDYHLSSTSMINIKNYRTS